jgi:hypothetical protein
MRIVKHLIGNRTTRMNEIDVKREIMEIMVGLMSREQNQELTCPFVLLLQDKHLRHATPIWSLKYNKLGVTLVLQEAEYAYSKKTNQSFN